MTFGETAAVPAFAVLPPADVVMHADEAARAHSAVRPGE